MNNSAKGYAFLIMAALVWGCSLVAQKAGLESIGPLWFTTIRCLMGGVVMLPVAVIVNGKEKKKLLKSYDTSDEEQSISTEEVLIKRRKNIFLAAICCGSLIGAVILIQQLGLPYTTVGKAGFITALYILITPIMGLFLGKKCRRNVWIAVVIGLAGMCLLCLYRGLDSVTFGDVMMLCASFLCAVHIHTIDHFVKDINPVMLTCLQFITAGLLCIVPTIIFEDISFAALRSAAVPVIYAGVFSCAVGYTFQTIGQKLTEPNIACLVLSMETVFSLLAGRIFFGEILTSYEYMGCVLMFAAIITAQLPEGKNRKINA